MTSQTKTTLLQLRRRFAGLKDGCHKQMGLRAVQEAVWLLGKNDERVAELAAKANFHPCLSGCRAQAQNSV